jgi:hypothetical protein
LHLPFARFFIYRFLLVTRTGTNDAHPQAQVLSILLAAPQLTRRRRRQDETPADGRTGTIRGQRPFVG